MPATSSSWLVGSKPFATDRITVGGFDLVVEEGDRYLRHPTTALSLIDYFRTVIAAGTSVATTITIRRNRTVRIEFASAMDIVWNTATAYRDALGFTADLPSATVHDAPNVSPLLWSPGWPAIPDTIAGVAGWSVDHKRRYKSDDGQRSYTDYYGSETWQGLELDHVHVSRMRVTTGGGGTFQEFYEQCAKLGYRFFHYEQVTEDASSTTDVTWPTGLGPYVLREMSGDWYRRRVKNADVSSPLTLPIHLVAEYS